MCSKALIGPLSVERVAMQTTRKEEVPLPHTQEEYDPDALTILRTSQVC